MAREPLLLQVSADLRRLEKQMLERGPRAVDQGSTRMERRAKQGAERIERYFGQANPGKALDSIFDRTRFTVLDNGAARVGLFGDALQQLGPAGFAAAAGIAAVAVAVAGARQAAAFADEIADTANRLHVTTDALQEYRYAIRLAGGEEKGADEALEAFSVTLGKAQQGLSKSVRGFLALGFTKDQIKGFRDADEALKAVSARIAGLSNVQQDAIIQQLGLEGLKPLIAQGVDEMERLRAEAHAVGVVMDASLIAKGAELNDQFETVAKVIDVQLKSALVELGPILVGLLRLVADLARAAGDVVGNFRQIEARRTDQLRRQLAQLDEQDARFGSRPDPSQRTVIARNAQARARIQAELAQRERAAANSPAPPRPTRELINTSKSGGGASSAQRDTTVQRTEQVEGAIAAAERDVLQALLQLTDDVEARAALQKQMVDAELAQDKARNAKQVADIEADKGLSAAKRAELVEQLQVVDLLSEEAARRRKEQIDAEAADALARQALNLKQVEIDGEEATLRLRQQFANSSAEQRDIALRLVDLLYQREKAELEAVIASQTAAEADKEIARRKLAQLEAQQPARRDEAERSTDAAREVGGIVQDIQKRGNLAEERAAMYAEVERLRQQDLISEEEAAQAKAEIDARYNAQRLQNAQSFFGNLATLSESSNKTLRAIGKAAAIAQATIDGVLAVQKALASAPPPFNFVLAAAAGAAAAVNVGKIAAMADGGQVRGPGGPRDDQVPVMLSNGEFVVNARDAQRHAALLEAINAGSLPRMADGGRVGGASLRSIMALTAGARPGVIRTPPGNVTLGVNVIAAGAIPREEIEFMVRRGSSEAVTQARALTARDEAARRYGEDLNA